MTDDSKQAPRFGRLLYALPLVLFGLLVGLVFLYGLQPDRDPALIPSVLIDRPAPAIDLPPLPGRNAGLTSETLRGQVSLVNVFGSYCPPCRVEHPLLLRLAQEYGVTIHGIAYKERRAEDAVTYLERMGDPFATATQDPDGRALLDWGVAGAPETFVIDAAGRVRYRHVGPIVPTDLEAVFLPLIAALDAEAGG